MGVCYWGFLWELFLEGEKVKDNPGAEIFPDKINNSVGSLGSV